MGKVWETPDNIAESEKDQSFGFFQECLKVDIVQRSGGAGRGLDQETAQNELKKAEL